MYVEILRGFFQIRASTESLLLLLLSSRVHCWRKGNRFWILTFFFLLPIFFFFCGKNACIFRHYHVEFEWACLNKVMESEWDMLWHFNYFTWWFLFQELVNVRIYIKRFFFSPWLWIKATWKIIKAVSHWNNRANSCKHLLLQCV